MFHSTGEVRGARVRTYTSTVPWYQYHNRGTYHGPLVASYHWVDVLLQDVHVRGTDVRTSGKLKEKHNRAQQQHDTKCGSRVALQGLQPLQLRLQLPVRPVYTAPTGCACNWTPNQPACFVCPPVNQMSID